VFPVVWTLLYLLMGLASWLVTGANATEDQKQMALSLYAVSLTANFLWPLLFFGLERYTLAFLWLLVLLALVLATWDRFRRLDRRAGKLLIPYVLWLCFAAYLNLGAAILN
jgi:tryptophan-rich sensory protein